MNITLAVDEQTARLAREAAEKMGKSLNQAVRDYLEQLAGSARVDVEHEAFVALCKRTGMKLNGWKFDRDEANER